MSNSEGNPSQQQQQSERPEQEVVSPSEVSLEKTKFLLKKGAEKRSLSVFSQIQTTEPKVKRRPESQEKNMSGDEIDDFEAGDAPSSPIIRPPSNFSSLSNTPPKQQTLSIYWCPIGKSLRKVSQLSKLSKKSHRVWSSCIRVILNEQNDASGDQFLRLVENVWSEYCEQMKEYIILTVHYNTFLREAALTIFREEIMENSTIQNRLIKEILRVIDEERKGNQIDRTLLRSLLRMLSSLQIYNQIFEGEFLKTTQSLFLQEGESLSRDLETPDYLRFVDRRLAEESSRVDFYLDETTRKPLILVTETCLIVNHMELIVNRGLDNLLCENRLDDLSLLFALLNRVKDGLNLLKIGFSNYIKKIGKTMIMDTERDKTMVEDLMKFKDKLDNIVTTCFGDSLKNEKFVQAEKDAFDYFVNTRPNKPAELIAKYMDSKLRSANKEASDEELDRLMDKVITLFRFIQGKDVFEAFYKKDLAKRLLLGRSASVDAEKAMLSKLRQECGAGFTQKLEGMFKDMELSKDLAFAFKQHSEHEAALGRLSVNMDFNVNVLTMGQWPPYEPVEVTLPPQLCSCLQLYQTFYDSKHNGRKLQWQHSLGQCVLKATFRTDCIKELQVSLYQGIVLLLFNVNYEWSFSDLAVATKIVRSVRGPVHSGHIIALQPGLVVSIDVDSIIILLEEKKELLRTLVSLSCAKIRVLLKSPKGREVKDDDKFTVNSGLQEMRYRIRISEVQMKETEEEHKQTEEQVNQDRQYQIDAAVVRIMKTRKTLQHQQLISELFAQLRFPVRSADLKKRIGSLIERDYLCRDGDDPNTYKYVVIYLKVYPALLRVVSADDLRDF
uniref:Cullin-4 n=1 Tax=Heterorhabditis bacteriophora TaxID=37862 RepID=A0A1I7XUR6_HETBA